MASFGGMRGPSRPSAPLPGDPRSSGEEPASPARGSARARHGPARRTPRVAFGGIAHETNTFNPIPTGLAAFRERALLQGDAVIAQARGARNALDGVVGAAEAAGVELVPTLFASAMPGGVVTAEAHAHLRGALLDRLRVAARRPWPAGLDGVVLLLHGAMVAADEDDVEGSLLGEVRTVVGPSVPVVAVLDSHANVSPAVIRSADLVLSYATYPHLDTFETGERAIERLLELRSDGPRPTTALRQVPLLAPLPPQRTTGETPMTEVLTRSADLARRPEVVEVAVCGGFPYADVPRAGLSLRVTTAGAPSLAEDLADRLAAVVWDRRERFAAPLPAPREAVERARSVAPRGGPVLLAETADNPGAGAPGDGTRLLSALLDGHVEGAVVAAIADPEAVAAATAAGVGATLTMPVGGNTHHAAGAPISRTWDVQAVSDGTFVNRGPLGWGRPTRLGRAVVLASDGVEVVVCERRVQALDPALLRSFGIEPRERRFLAVKSSVHYRAAFDGLAGVTIEVGGPGLSGSDLATFPYRRVRRPIAPLDCEVRYLD